MSLLSSLDLDLELAGGHARDLRRDHGVDPEVGQGAPHQPTRERHKLGACLQILTVLAGLGQEPEAVVLKYVNSLVIGPQIVNLFPIKHMRVNLHNFMLGVYNVKCLITEASVNEMMFLGHFDFN